MSDIAKRLRENADLDSAEGGNLNVCQLEWDAADHIDALTSQLTELEAHLRTIAKFGGTLDQARELAAKGIERAAQVAKGPKCAT